MNDEQTSAAEILATILDVAAVCQAALEQARGLPEIEQAVVQAAAGAAALTFYKAVGQPRRRTR